MRDQPDIYGANGGASLRDSGREVGGRSQVTAKAAAAAAVGVLWENNRK